VRLRYNQAVLGVAWVVLQPLGAALVFAVIFGRMAKLPTGGVPYLLFALIGMVGWTIFSGAVTRAGNSLVGQSNLITKVYFPRLILPLSALGSVVVDLLVGMLVIALLLLVYGIAPTWRVFALPLFIFEIGVAAAGISCWVAALGVYYRDFIYALPFAVQIWLYASPVAFSAELVPARWRAIFSLNPLVAGLEGMRWSLLGSTSLAAPHFAISASVALVVWISGMTYFRLVERKFADVI
jgi:lipopolysaccharide transport system permease protein